VGGRRRADVFGELGEAAMILDGEQPFSIQSSRTAISRTSKSVISSTMGSGAIVIVIVIVIVFGHCGFLFCGEELMNEAGRWLGARRLRASAQGSRSAGCQCRSRCSRAIAGRG
jgi:hypothetical protein